MKLTNIWYFIRGKVIGFLSLLSLKKKQESKNKTHIVPSRQKDKFYGLYYHSDSDSELDDSDTELDDTRLNDTKFLMFRK